LDSAASLPLAVLLAFIIKLPLLTLQVLLKILNPVFFATFGKMGIATAV
jgi:hypothetical protein